MLKIKQILFLIIIGTQLIQAQSFIEGTISDYKGKIPFANIQIKDINIGTAADAEGHFKIEAPAGITILKYSNGLPQIQEKNKINRR